MIRKPTLRRDAREEQYADVTHRLMPIGLAIVIGAFVLAGCGCDEDPTDENDEPGCTTTAECIEMHDDRWYCDDGECVRGPRYCENDADCCPGQECSHGICLDSYESCTEDDECGVAGQVCKTRLVNREEQTVCTFALCDAGDCPDELFCFAGFCVGENPCRGGCASGHACVLSNNKCHPAPMCDMSCDPGSILTFADPSNVDDDCDISSLDCICEPLPPLTPRDMGRHSSIARLPDGTLAVSSYNGDYGDLIVTYFDSSGVRVDTDWVDGMPSGARPVANPAGAREGIDEPGPNVGRYTSIAASSDSSLHVSYFDVDESSLKYARRSGDTWSSYVIDEEGDVGRYSFLALDDLGVPAIAYFRRRGVEDDRFVTALKLARASTPAPAGPSDWSVVTVESMEIKPPPCDGGCAGGEHCVDDGEAIDCYPSASGCEDCGDGERCVDLGEGPVCRKRVSTTVLEDLPMGTGLFPSVIVTPGGVLAMVYYDYTTGSLKLAENSHPTDEEPFAVHILDDGDEGDVGRYPSVALTSQGNLAVVYQDANLGQLRWLESSLSGEVLSSDLADDGVREQARDTVNRVGVDNALIVTSDGRWLVFHQNATSGELVMSTRDAGQWSHETLAGDGPAGFWVSAVHGDGSIYISHASIRGESRRPVTSKLAVESVRP